MNFIVKLFRVLFGSKPITIQPIQNEPSSPSDPIFEIAAENPPSIPEEVIASTYPWVSELKVDRAILYKTINRSDRGLLENYFYDYAKPLLGNNFFNNVSIEIGAKNITPDFAYIDSINNKFYVLEIDEPYTVNLQNKFIPTHHIGSVEERNNLLLNNGWSIVRIAEEQIAKWPERCAVYFQSIIYLTERPNLSTVSCWSVEDASEMILKNYRLSYLPVQFKNIIPRQGNFSYRSFNIHSISQEIAKNKKSFAVLKLYSPSEDDINVQVILQCWIPEDVFWKSILESKLKDVISKHNLKHSYLIFHSIKNSDWRFEGYGKTSSPYYNLFDYENFKFVFSEQGFNRVSDRWDVLVNKIYNKETSLSAHIFKYNKT